LATAFFIAGLEAAFAGATVLVAGFAAALGKVFAAGLTPALVTAGFATAFGATLDFVAGFGLEAAAAAFGLAAVLGLDGALAMNSPTPRFSWLMLAQESTPARASSRNDSGV